MKIILSPVLLFGFVIVGCKRDQQSTNSGKSVPETEHKIPAPHPVDTLVAAPTYDTVSSENDSGKALR